MKTWMWWALGLGATAFVLNRMTATTPMAPVATAGKKECRRAVSCFLQKYDLHVYPSGDAAADAMQKAKNLCAKYGIDPVKVEESLTRSEYMFLQC